MAPYQTATLLERVEEKMNIDIDTLDTDFIRSLPITPNDQTSNPAWLLDRLQAPSTPALAAEIIRIDPELQQNRSVDILLAKLAIAFCKQNLPYIKGRVLVQTSPSKSNEVLATVQQALLYAREFHVAGIPKTRYCVKVMATRAGVVAARILYESGIPILGTGVFSVAQAVACFQARCLYVSPYYNGITELRDLTSWKDYNDPALEHPFSSRLAQMVAAYKALYLKTGQQPPLIKNAGFASYKEIIASMELGCHSTTISTATAREMQGPALRNASLENAPQSKLSTLSSPYAADVLIPSPRLGSLLQARSQDIDVDYLKNDGQALGDAILNDEIANRRITDALQLFQLAEQASREIVRRLLDASLADSSKM